MLYHGLPACHAIEWTIEITIGCLYPFLAYISKLIAIPPHLEEHVLPVGVACRYVNKSLHFNSWLPTWSILKRDWNKWLQFVGFIVAHFRQSSSSSLIGCGRQIPKHNSLFDSVGLPLPHHVVLLEKISLLWLLKCNFNFKVSILYTYEKIGYRETN